MFNKLNSDQTKRKTIRLLVILACIVLFAFIVVNLIWIFSTYIPYQNWSNGMDKVEIDEINVTYYEKEIDDYDYILYKPGYLDFSGHFSLSDIETQVVEIDDDGNSHYLDGMDITLYIWPNINGKIDLGIFFVDGANDIFLQTYIDSEMNLVDKENMTEDDIETALDLIENNHDEIETLINNAKVFWQLNYN